MGGNELLILASGSPRRRELLAQADIACTVEPSAYEEASPQQAAPADYVVAQALGKARDISQHHAGQWVLGADTVVTVDHMILGKPHSPEEAAAMLRRLSGRSHSVFTGVALVKDRQELSCIVETKVWFRVLADWEISRYVGSGEPMDKAGAYGIQGKAASFVEKIDGSYTNVVGLPLAQVHELLVKAGVAL